MVEFTWAVLDDEPPALAVLELLMEPVKNARCVGCWSDPAAALEAVAANPPDLLFLDVEMPRMTGLQFLEQLPAKPVTALVTAHPEYAVQAFSLGVREYILKPVSAERLAVALDNLRPLLAVDDANAFAEMLAFKSGHDQVFLDPAEIVRIRADGNFSHLLLIGGDETMVSEPLSQLESRLEPFGFLRIHRSDMVNRKHVTTMSRSAISLSDGQSLAVGRAYTDRATNLLS